MTEDTLSDQCQTTSDERATADAAENTTPAPDATINVYWVGNGFKLDVSRSTDLSHPAAFFADWFVRNSEPLTGIAASEFQVRQQLTASALAQGAELLKQQMEGAPLIAESATPRLLSASGGPLN